jgi:hypothetical protein
LDGGSAHLKASTYTGQHNTEKRGHISMPRARFETTIQVFERSKTVRGSDRVGHWDRLKYVKATQKRHRIRLPNLMFNLENKQTDFHEIWYCNSTLRTVGKFYLVQFRATKTPTLLEVQFESIFLKEAHCKQMLHSL